MRKVNDELPEGWVWKKVSDLGEVLTGTTPTKAKKEYYDSKDYPFFKPTDLNEGYYVKKSEDGLSKKGIEEARLLPAKSILVTCIGATIGKTGLIRVSGAFNQQINAIVPQKNVVPEFVYFVCISPQFQKSIVDNASATTLPILNKRKFEMLTMPMPPLIEQQQIVEEIEKQFSRLDEAVAALKRVRVSLKRYKASVLKAAVEGKLTEEWRSRRGAINCAHEGRMNPAPTKDETGAELLKRILAERKKKWEENNPKKKYKEPSAPDTSKLPELPKGWVWATVGQISESMKNGIYKPRDSYSANGVACLRMYNIEDGRIVWKDIKRMTLNKAETEEYKLLPGDLLVNRVNSRELVGKAAPIPEGLESCIFESKNIRVRFQNEFIDTNFVSYIFSVYGQAFFNRNAQQVVGMASISQPQVSALPVPLCSFTEQKSIVEEAEHCLSVTEEIEKTVETNLKRAERLRQAILKKAFAGRLVSN